MTAITLNLQPAIELTDEQFKAIPISLSEEDILSGFTLDLGDIFS